MLMITGLYTSPVQTKKKSYKIQFDSKNNFVKHVTRLSNIMYGV